MTPARVRGRRTRRKRDFPSRSYHPRSRSGHWQWILPVIFLAGIIFFVLWAEGRVLRVYDGDTVLMMYNLQRIRVRLWGIDAPEKDQLPAGIWARDSLRKYVLWKKVLLEPRDTDQYGRVVAILYVQDTVNVNLRMVEQGLAYVYRRYNSDPRYYEAEQRARTLHRGIWQIPPEQRIPPWEWRRQQRRRHHPKHPPQ